MGSCVGKHLDCVVHIFYFDGVVADNKQKKPRCLGRGSVILLETPFRKQELIAIFNCVVQCLGTPVPAV